LPLSICSSHFPNKKPAHQCGKLSRRYIPATGWHSTKSAVAPLVLRHRLSAVLPLSGSYIYLHQYYTFKRKILQENIEEFSSIFSPPTNNKHRAERKEEAKEPSPCFHREFPIALPKNLC
jgi:hypothetical protein